jgi:hypothetical protein
MSDDKEPIANLPGQVPPILNPFYARKIIMVERYWCPNGRQNPSASRTFRLSTRPVTALLDVALPVEIMWFHAPSKVPGGLRSGNHRKRRGILGLPGRREDPRPTAGAGSQLGWMVVVR